MKKIAVALALVGAASSSVKAADPVAGGDYVVLAEEGKTLVSVTVAGASQRYTGKKLDLATGKVTALSGKIDAETGSVTVTPEIKKAGADTVPAVLQALAAADKADELVVPGTSSAYLIAAKTEVTAENFATLYPDKKTASDKLASALTDATAAVTTATDAVTANATATETAADASDVGKALRAAAKAAFDAHVAAVADLTTATTTLKTKQSALVDANKAVAAARKDMATNAAIGALLDAVVVAQTDVTDATKALAATAKTAAAATVTKNSSQAEYVRFLNARLSADDLKEYKKKTALEATVSAKTAAQKAIQKKIDAADAEVSAFIASNKNAYITVLPVGKNISLAGVRGDGAAFSYTGPSLASKIVGVAPVKNGVLTINHATDLGTTAGVDLNLTVGKVMLPTVTGATVIGLGGGKPSTAAAGVTASITKKVGDADVTTAYVLTAKNGKISLTAAVGDAAAKATPSALTATNGALRGTIGSSKVFGLIGTFGDATKVYSSFADFAAQ
ncbi:MAG: hypothetical protein WCO60_11110 [Verrucomicrobiota bacterium]